jgi:hypothetical protein
VRYLNLLSEGCFEYNNCLPTCHQCRAATHFSHHKLKQRYALPDNRKDGKNRLSIIYCIFSNNVTIPSDIWTVGKERMNDVVYIEHMSCKFLGSFHTPPTLCRCLETLFMTFEINSRFQITA